MAFAAALRPKSVKTAGVTSKSKSVDVSSPPTITTANLQSSGSVSVAISGTPSP